MPVVVVSAAVEGDLDEAVARRLITEAGGKVGTVYGKSGKLALKRGIGGYNAAARYAPWLVLVDLDHSAECAPPLKQEWLPHPSPQLCFRVAVREIEAWLLADVETLSAHLSVPRGRFTLNPELLDDPKAEMVNLARHSRRGAIKADLVPRERSGREVGPAYSSRLIEYVESEWRPREAATRSDSLRRSLHHLVADLA
jgi:hypothetical protein